MDAINLDIVDYVLTHPGQAIAFEADTRAGKTSLLAYIFAKIYATTHKEEENRLKIYADILRKMGYEKVQASKHCIYSNFKNKLFIPTKWQQFCHLAKYKLNALILYKTKKQQLIRKLIYTRKQLKAELGNEPTSLEIAERMNFSAGEVNKILEQINPLTIVKPYMCELKDLRMPNNKKPYKHFEQGSIIGISEAVSEELNNLEGQYDSEMQKFLKRKSHNKITLILETQKFGRSAKWFRENINTLFFIKQRYNYKNGKIEYYCYMYEGSEFVEKYGYNHTPPLSESQIRSAELKNKDIEDLKQIKYVKLTAKLPHSIYDYYNSEEHQTEFLEDLVNYSHEVWEDEEKTNKATIDKQAQKRRNRERAEEISELKQKLLNDKLNNEAKIEIQKQLKELNSQQKK